MDKPSKSDDMDIENQPPSTEQVDSSRVEVGINEKYGATRSLVEKDLLDTRYAPTHRGLKNRHVQMM